MRTSVVSSVVASSLAGVALFAVASFAAPAARAAPPGPIRRAFQQLKQDRAKEQVRREAEQELVAYLRENKPHLIEYLADAQRSRGAEARKLKFAWGTVAVGGVLLGVAVPNLVTPAIGVGALHGVKEAKDMEKAANRRAATATVAQALTEPMPEHAATPTPAHIKRWRTAGLIE
jgi:hypothetical protein